MCSLEVVFIQYMLNIVTQLDKASTAELQSIYKWDKVFKNEPSKIGGGQPLTNLKGYALL